MARKILPNNQYWVQRIKEEDERLYRMNVKDQELLLKKVYREQGDILRHKLDRVLLKMAQDQEEKGKIYANDYYRTVGAFELREEFQKRARIIGEQQLGIEDEYLVKAYRASKDIVADYSPSPFGIGFGVPSAVRDEDIVRAVWCLDGKSYSDRIWADKAELVEALNKTMTDCVARGETVDNITKSLIARLAISYENANRLARTETAHAQVIGQIDKYKELGFTVGVIDADKRSDRTCQDCLDLDGQEFPLEQIRTLIPRHPNCRCGFLIKKGDIKNELG